MKTKILVVDDEELLCDVFIDYFTRKGFTVFSAKSGQEALAILNKEDIAFAFVDLRLPGIDGLNLAKMILKKASTDVVLMTAYPTLNTAMDAIKIGASDYLIKPFQIEKLEEYINQKISFYGAPIEAIKSVENENNEAIQMPTNNFRAIGEIQHNSSINRVHHLYQIQTTEYLKSQQKDNLIKLEMLLKEGHISESEFHKKKNEIMNTNGKK